VAIMIIYIQWSQQLFPLHPFLFSRSPLPLLHSSDPNVQHFLSAHHSSRRDATPLRRTPMGAYHRRQGELARSLLSCVFLSSSPFVFVLLLLLFFFVVVVVSVIVSFKSRSYAPHASRSHCSYRDPTDLLLTSSRKFLSAGCQHDQPAG